VAIVEIPIPNSESDAFKNETTTEWSYVTIDLPVGFIVPIGEKVGQILDSYFRWPINIPAGSEIVSCEVTFHCMTHIGTVFTAYLIGLDVANCPDFTSDQSGLPRSALITLYDFPVYEDCQIWGPIDITANFKEWYEAYYVPGYFFGMVVDNGTADSSGEYLKISSWDRGLPSPRATLKIEYIPPPVVLGSRLRTLLKVGM